VGQAEQSDGGLPAAPKPAPARAAGRKALTAAQTRYHGTYWQQFFHQLGELEFFDQTMLFAAGLLISLIPFLIVVSSFAS
jgi:hypothetical protein